MSSSVPVAIAVGAALASSNSNGGSLSSAPDLVLVVFSLVGLVMTVGSAIFLRELIRDGEVALSFMIGAICLLCGLFFYVPLEILLTRM